MPSREISLRRAFDRDRQAHPALIFHPSLGSVTQEHIIQKQFIYFFHHEGNINLTLALLTVLTVRRLCDMNPPRCHLVSK